MQVPDMSKLSMFTIVNIDRHFRAVCDVRTTDKLNFSHRVTLLLRILEEHDFRATLAAAIPLEQFKIAFDEDVDPKAKLSANVVNHIHGLVESIGSTFKGELEERQIIELHLSIISDSIKSLPTRLQKTELKLNPEQTVMYDDTVR